MCTDNITRRGFLVGCSAGIAGLAGSRFNTLAFAGDGVHNQETLVVVFLRGGIDGLNFMPPIAGSDRGHYETARPGLQVPNSGAGAALGLDAQFGMHPSAAPLHELYQDGKLALVHATGMPTESTRSHFDAMDYIELGTPGIKGTSSGWLTRHLQSATNLPDEIIMPSLAVGSLQQVSQLGNYETINLTDPGNFRFDSGAWRWRDAQRTALRRLYQGGSTNIHLAGTQALDAVDIIELNGGGNYTPSNGAVYPAGSFGENLQVVAQMIKLNLGLRVATVDLGGWDTHEGQGDGSGGYFAGLVGELSQGLAALYTDLDSGGADNPVNKMTVVGHSEFGRRFGENGDGGSDHGYGNVMMVLGGETNGGLYGSWPGLAPGQLFEGMDLAVTTDFRQVLSELLIRRMGNNQIGTIFPGYLGYSPMGLVQGTDLPPDYSGGLSSLFSDDFESGGPSSWTIVNGG
ncbi:MAG: DUF1501 domain-containing protein [Acidobacteriota bacterium]